MGGFKIGGAIGGLWERNKKDIAKWAPLALNAIPGLGTAAAAGLGAAINYGANKNLGQALGAGGLSALGALGGKIPGVQRVQDALAKIPGAGKVTGFVDKMGGLGQFLPQGKLPGAQSVQDILAGLGGNLGQAAGAAGNWLGGNGGMNALGAAQGLNAAMLGQKSSNFADMAAKNVDEAWKQRAPLREAGVAGMLNPKTVDTSALRRISARGNPFAERPTPVQGY